MGKIKAIIFDCFGVLYPDASWVFYRRHESAFRGNDEFLATINEEIDLGKINQAHFFDKLAQKINIPAVDIKAEMDQILIVNKPLVKLIETLKQQYKVAMLSNTGPGELDIMERDGIADLFDVIIASYKVGITKPNPGIFQKAIDILAVKANECLFIDDRLVNIEAAEKVGMATIHYHNVQRLRNDLTKILVRNP